MHPDVGIYCIYDVSIFFFCIILLRTGLKILGAIFLLPPQASPFSDLVVRHREHLHLLAA
jgi:hypothetical protein